MLRRSTLVFFLAMLLATEAGAQSTVFSFVTPSAPTRQRRWRRPDLSEAGRASSRVARDPAQDAGITAIFVTEFKRTQQTAAPLARRSASRSRS
jgi:hypothetical protein